MTETFDTFSEGYSQRCSELQSKTQLFQKDFDESMLKIHQIANRFIDCVTRGIGCMHSHGNIMDEHLTVMQKAATDIHDSITTELTHLTTKVTKVLEVDILKLQESAIKSQGKVRLLSTIASQ